MRIAIAGAVALAWAVPPAFAQDGALDLYARVERRLSGDPELAAALGRPAPEMVAAEWLVGEWNVEAEVTESGRPPERGTSVVTTLYGGTWLEIRDTYPGGVQDVGYLGYTPASGHWTSVSLDSLGNANLVTSPGWVGDRLVFEADVTVLGIKAHLRQTFTREGPDAYRIDNEERIGTAWKHLDRYRYTRKRAR